MSTGVIDGPFSNSLNLLNKLIREIEEANAPKTTPKPKPDAAAEAAKPKDAKDSKDGKKKGSGRAPPAPEAPVESMTKINFLVGEIIDAKKHPDSDKLLVETINVGEEQPRTICSGIAAFYQPGDLVGKKCVIVANLEPRKIAGIPSAGMVLCAGSSDKSQVEIIEPAATAVPGTRVVFPGYEGPAEPVLKKKLAVHWENVMPDLKTDDKAVATYKGIPFATEQGPVKAASLANASIS